tara:strand:+ start:2050 stop:2172 length:123 start_codon:yes stop_codon:yes gene_type:complete
LGDDAEDGLEALPPASQVTLLLLLKKLPTCGILGLFQRTQ